LAHFMLVETTNLVKNLLVYPENMQRNLNCYGGVVFSQQVLLALVAKGLTRENAYAIVQGNAHAAWNQPGGDFQALVRKDVQVTAHLNTAEIDECFNPQRHLQHVQAVFDRLGI
jgi:adenylosuccinate lyase